MMGAWIGAILASPSLAADREPPAPGLVLDAAPKELATRPEPEPSIRLLRSHLEAADTVRALRVANGFLATAARGRERDAVQLAVGLIHREAGRHNLASEAFTPVRRADGPLAPWGAYYEAEQDFLRGKPGVAISECARYRRKWGDGPHSGACLRLIARAQAELGQRREALASAEAYDEDHRLGPITEQIELALAARALLVGDVRTATTDLTSLAVSHSAPLTGRIAEELLVDLQEQGHAAEVPTDPAASMSRALSLRDASRRKEAWSLYEELVRRTEGEPQLRPFVEDEAERFGWRTRQWDFLAQWYSEQYQDTEEPAEAWSQYRSLFRGGRHVEAVDLALEMQQRHAKDRRWRRSHEDVGRVMLLAGRYEQARAQFDTVASLGGWTGRRGRFFAAFASLMAGDPKDAAARLSKVIEENRAWLTEARYWRAEALESLESPLAADADREWILENEPNSWYSSLVLLGRDVLPAEAPFRRNGRWAGAAREELQPTSGRETRPSSTLPVAKPYAAPPRVSVVGLASLSWPWETRFQIPEAPDLKPAFDPEASPPRSYRSSELWDAQGGRVALAKFAAKFGRYWPELRAINDLATVGLYDLSGPLMSEWYDQWRRAYRRRNRTARRVRSMSTEDWRTLFLAARDHHHASRFSFGMMDDASEDLRLEAMRLAYPLAHDHVVWNASQQHDVDPYLVMGLMRQESTYRATAVSRVGARGAMQIMPRTGHLLADLARDTHFTAGDLEDPTLSVRYGITYLGLLLERFDGAFPLAVASYNGGPFNVSSWLKGTGSDLPMDAFVEHIPFRETRDYVKRVTAGYAAYVALYGPPGARVAVPPFPRGDDAEVVDF